MFERSRLGLRDWFTMIWRMVYDSKLRSAAEFRREFLTHVPKSTIAAWRYQGKLRKLMSQPRQKISGKIEFKIMQLVVRGGSKVNVCMFVQRRHNRRGLIKLRGVAGSSSKGAKVLVDDSVARDRSVLYVESCAGYETLGNAGYELKSVPRSSLLRLERTCAELQNYFHQNHRGGIGCASIQEYLNEFAFRFNARRSAKPGYIFRELLLRAVQHPASVREPLTTK